MTEPRLEQEGRLGVNARIPERALPMRHGREHVDTGFHQFRHVVGVVLSIMIGIATRGPSAEKLPVEVEHVIVVRSDVDLGQARLVGHRKCLAKICEVVLVAGSIPDIFCSPLVLRQSGVEAGRHAVRRRFSCRIPDAHLPPEPRGGWQRRAGVGNARRLVRIHFAAVPHVAFCLRQEFAAGGNQNSVRGLRCSASGIRLTPCEPHGIAFDGQWIAHAIHEQVNGSGGLAGNYACGPGLYLCLCRTNGSEGHCGSGRGSNNAEKIAARGMHPHPPDGISKKPVSGGL